MNSSKGSIVSRT